MGLLDVINGMQHGPRGQPQPSAAGSGSGGMSPITMALLGLLAYKALKSSGGLGHIFGGAQPAQPGSAPPPASPAPGASASTSAPGGGGLGDILGGLFGGGAGGDRPGGGLVDLIPGGLGGLLGGAAAGNMLSRGLGNLVQDLQESGQDGAVQSWVGRGPNQEISPDKLEAALGADTLDTLSKQTGMKREELLAGLSQNLPGVIDHLTPDGRLPTEEEASRMV
jgi:uncharacterized protein YidB (DUF937 family)